MTIEDFQQLVKKFSFSDVSVSVFEVTVKDLLFSDFTKVDNNSIIINNDNIVSQIKPSHYWSSGWVSSNSYLNSQNIGERVIYTVSHRVNDLDWSLKTEYFHPRHLFRFEQDVILYSRIPLPMDYRTKSHTTIIRQTSELNNRKIIEALCKNSNITSFLSYRIKKENGNAQKENYLKEPKVYVLGEEFYAYFAPELLLETSFGLKYGKPDLSIETISLNKYRLSAYASTSAGYLKYQDTHVSAIFDLKAFSFEEFYTDQEVFSLK